MENPTIVFVPGAWHTSAAFQPVISLLKSHSYPSIGLHLPSVGGSPVVTSMDPDKALIRSTVSELVDAGKEVVVVSHSYGGAPASSALEGLSITERTKAGKKGGVIAMAMISTFLLDVGRSLLNGGEPASWVTHEGPSLIPHSSASVFYNDLSATEAAYWTSQLLPQARSPMDAPLTSAAWKLMPVHYMLCELDNAIPLAFQRKMCEDAIALGADVRMTSVQAGHSPFLSMPETVERWIRGTAGEIVKGEVNGKVVANGEADGKVQNGNIKANGNA